MSFPFLSLFSILLLLYFIGGTFLSFKFSKKQKGSSSDFFLGSFSLPWVVLALSYGATTYSSFMMVGLVSLAAKTGMGALFFEGLYLIATVLFLFFLGNKIRQVAQDKKVFSPAHLVAACFDTKVAIFVTVVSVVALVPYTSVQISGAGLVLQHMLPFGSGQNAFFASSLLVMVVIALWAGMGGIRGVAWTDALSAVFMFVIVLVVFFVLKEKTTAPLDVGTFPSKIWTPKFFITLSVPWVFFSLTNPQVLGRLFLLKDKQDVFRMTLGFGLFGLLFTFLACFIGFYAKGLLSAETMHVANITPFLLQLLPSSLAAFWALGIVAASITTANSIALSLSSMAVVGKKESFSPKWSKVSLWGFCLVAFVFAMTKPPFIVLLSVLSAKILLSLLPVYLFSLFGSRKIPSVGAYVSICMGVLVVVVASYWKIPYDSVLILLVSTLGLLPSFFLTPLPKNSEKKI